MTIANFLMCAVVGACVRASNPVARQNVNRWPGDNPATTRPAMVMVGDSIIASWPRLGVLNHGIGGQLMSEIAAYLSADALAYMPRAVVLNGGINDLRRGSDVDSVIQSALSAIRQAEAVNVKVYYVNLIPYEQSGQNCVNISQAAVNQINAFIAAVCADKTRCVRVDAAAEFGGAYNPALYAPGDCLHPNAAGNALLDRALDAAVASSPY